MKSSRILLLLFLLVLIFLSATAQTANPTSNDTSANAAVLIDSSGIIGSEDRSARIDYLINETSNLKGSQALIVLYCGKVCHYGEVEAHIRGINDKFRRRGFEKERFSIIFGGYMNKFTTEMWVIPENGKTPLPKPEIPIERVEFKGNYAWRLEPYDCCDYDDASLTAFLPREVTELPKVIKNFLEKSVSFEVLMQTREENGKLVAAMTRDYNPNLRKSVSDRKARERLLRSFYKASDTSAMGAACYLPSHSIEAADGDRSVEIEICFGCRRYTITGSFGTFVGTLEYDNEAEALFNDFLLPK